MKRNKLNFNRRTIGLAVALLITGLLGAGALTPTPTQAQGPSAAEIMQQAKDRWQGEDFTSKVKLTTVEPGGGETVLDVDFKAKLIEESRESGAFRYKVLARVLAPEDVEGLAVLIQEQQFPTPDDIWLYLPALNSSKKISLEDFRNPLFGSEFVFEDVIGREPGLDTHELLREDTLNDRLVWVIKSTPNDPDLAGFAYRVTYVEKETLLEMRMELYNENDDLIKLYQAEEIVDLQDIPTWVKATAENLETGRVTTFEFLEPAYNTGVPDDIFDPDKLGQL
jgi:hypothetical protein